MDEKAAKALDAKGRDLLAGLVAPLDTAEWNDHALETLVRHYAEGKGEKLGTVAQPLRIALTGSTNSPPLFAVMRALGREESLGRIDDVLKR
jgi:glutamyl-tRNA synthetase